MQMPSSGHMDLASCNSDMKWLQAAAIKGLNLPSKVMRELNHDIQPIISILLLCIFMCIYIYICVHIYRFISFVYIYIHE